MVIFIDDNNKGNIMKLISKISNEFEKRKERNSSYSIRAFARDIGVSHGHLLQLLSGKKSFSYKIVDKIIESLEITKTEADLILGDFKVEEKVKENIRKLLKGSIGEELAVKPIGAEEYIPISHWSYDAIFHLVEDDCSSKLDQETSISVRLNLPIKEVQEKLEKLLIAKVIEVKEKFYIKTCGSYYMRGGATEMRMNELVDKFSNSQRELYEYGMSQFNPLSESNNQFSTQAYRVSEDQIETIRKSILNFSDSIEQTLRLGDDEESKTKDIYFFNTQLFSVTPKKMPSVEGI
jgi:uncharacterized protein (TIGR02147 family)